MLDAKVRAKLRTVMRDKRPRRLTQEQVALAAQMVIDGETYRAIGKHFGVTGSAIFQRLRNAAKE